MSAFLLSREALSNLSFEFIRLHHDGRTIRWNDFVGESAIIPSREWRIPDYVFRILLTENLRSLKARYPSRNPPDDHHTRGWRYVPPAAAYLGKVLDAAWLVHLCDCYHYQCCETKDYGDTPAAKIVDGTRKLALERLVPDLPDHPRWWGEPLIGYVESGEP